MNTIRIRWEIISGTPPDIIYFVNDRPIGEGNIGFDKILNMIKSNKKIEVIMEIRHISSLGGDSLENTFPFKDRFNELKKALGPNKLIYKFS